ncbi:hypothetical protein Btru_054595 [Bulinus truncatus]|nr:hypothetical protein Btru_054595 [Bulinus truncatus]
MKGAKEGREARGQAPRLMSWNRFGSQEMESLTSAMRSLQQSSYCAVLLLAVLPEPGRPEQPVRPVLTPCTACTCSPRPAVPGLFAPRAEDPDEEEYFMGLNYALLVFMAVLGALSAPLPFGHLPARLEGHKVNVADGAWVVTFIALNVYALMPLRSLAKCLFGGLPAPDSPGRFLADVFSALSQERSLPD